MKSTNNMPVLRRLCGNQTVRGREFNAREMIVLATFIRRYITLSQIKTIMPGYSNGSLRKYISDIILDGLILSNSSDVGNISVYCITRKGIDYALEQLRTVLSDNADESITDIAGSGYTQVPVPIARATHKIYANDVFFYIASLENMPRYFYTKEQPLDAYGNILDKTDTSFINQKYVVPDGLLRYCMFNRDMMPEEHSIYIEQDMGTQSESMIVFKLSHYIDCLLCHIHDYTAREICFSLFSPKEARKKQKKKISVPNDVVIFLKTVLFICPTFNGDPAICDLYAYLKDTKEIKQYVGEIFYKKALAVLRQLKKENGEMAARDVLLNLNSTDEPIDYVNLKLRQSYIKRRSSYYHFVSSLPSMEYYLLNGFDINFVPNDAIDDTFKYTHIHKIGAEKDLLDKLSAVFENMSYFGKYELTEASITFRLSYNTGNSVIIVENITDSVGGYTRMKHLYTNTIKTEGIYTLMLADDEKSIRSFLKDISVKFKLLEGAPQNVPAGYPVFLSYAAAGFGEYLIIPYMVNDDLMMAHINLIK